MRQQRVRHWRVTACLALIGLLMPIGLASIPPASAQPASAQPASAQEAARAARQNASPLSLLAGGAGETDTEIAAEMAYALADEPHLQIMPVLGPVLGQRTSTTVTELLASRNIDVAIMHTDALTESLLTRTDPRASNIEYIAKLFQEEVHILAQGPIASLADLAGKPVEVGPAGSATALTSRAIFSSLHIAPQEMHDLDTVSLERLRLGQAVAVVVVGGKPVPALLRIPPASGLHFLPIPLTPKLVDTYLPSSLETTAYPGLVPPDQVIETVAVGSILVALPRQADARSKRIDRFVDALFARFGLLRQPGFHPKWRDVSLSAQFPGIKRYAEADRLLREVALQPPLQRQARH